VQVVFTVAEIGQGGGKFLFGDVLIVAAEAEIVLAGSIGTVEIAREVTDQQVGKFGAMYPVAAGAVAGFDGAVPIFRRRNFIAEIDMAAEAEFLRGVFQERLVVRGMGVVAFGATLLGHRRVLDLGSHILVDTGIAFAVATLAECLGVFG